MLQQDGLGKDSVSLTKIIYFIILPFSNRVGKVFSPKRETKICIMVTKRELTEFCLKFLVTFVWERRKREL